MKAANRIERVMRTRGEIEAAHCEGVIRFEQEHITGGLITGLLPRAGRPK